MAVSPGSKLFLLKLAIEMLSKVPCATATLTSRAARLFPVMLEPLSKLLTQSECGLADSQRAPCHCRTLPLLTCVGRLSQMKECTSVCLCFSASCSCLCQKPGGVCLSGSWEQACSSRHGFERQDRGRNTGSTGSDPKLPSVVKLCHLDSRK